jgi:hypothetical protein
MTITIDVTTAKKRWLKALRSGDYKQGKYKLYNQDTKAYCCLGVLCEVLELKAEDWKQPHLGRLPKEACELMGLDDLASFSSRKINKEIPTSYRNLIYLNDLGISFDHIADVIEKYF